MKEDCEKDYQNQDPRIVDRFRSFLPVVVDVETGGFNPATDALLEIAAVLVHMDDRGELYRGETYRFHVAPFEGANIEAAALEVTGIDPDHPLRPSMKEADALGRLFKPIRAEVRNTGCTRAILVGHNSWFDLQFLNAAVERCGIKRNPFHPFSSFDTATLGGAAFGQTVLHRAAKAAGLRWDDKAAHSAAYDAEQTAELFCDIINRLKPVYQEAIGNRE
ncbi:ribonuclease T [Gammaproteobacteria bacterium AB-CW1]|uniref:Ribonuclease T n=1 Tax=Natronospira elongata TaxID=3110268 RepID=A0AAP6JE10_9GAMM|nr:ribonuclease T [Gammaproteobacteria bacterium AB-CW1]